MNAHNYKYLIFFISFLLIQGLQAQVTIGTADAPVPGALLQLKTTGDTSAKANADKGLGMPRVFLSDIDKLSPMYSYADADNTPSANDVNEHIGLVVYNTNICLQAKGEDAGIYVWNGNEWKPLGKKGIASSVEMFTDPRDGETYLIGDFQTAGVWMLENLRAKVYDQDPGSPPNLSNVISSTAKNYLYPQSSTPASSFDADGLSDVTYRKNKSVGLLYNWAAATNNENSADREQGNTDYGVNQPVVQGICPQGWHLPSDKEWSDLENEIIRHVADYSTSTSAEVNGSASYDGISWRGNHGTAMKAPCRPLSGTLSVGTSLPITKGGFFGLLAGYSYGPGGSGGYGALSYFWTSSSANVSGGLHAWVRELGTDPGVWRNPLTRSDFSAVRCKRNNP